MENDKNFDKKVIIIILHNLACCYQKMKDFESCISYLEAVLYHFDGKLESKYNIKITPQGMYGLDKLKYSQGISNSMIVKST